MRVFSDLARDDLGALHGLVIVAAVQTRGIDQTVTVSNIEIVARLFRGSERLRVRQCDHFMLVPGRLGRIAPDWLESAFYRVGRLNKYRCFAAADALVRRRRNSWPDD